MEDHGTNSGKNVSMLLAICCEGCKNAAMCALHRMRDSSFSTASVMQMTLQEMPKVVREHRPFVEVRLLNSFGEMTPKTSVDLFFFIPGGLATEWHGHSLCQQRLAGLVIGWLDLLGISGFSNLIMVVFNGSRFDLYSHYIHSFTLPYFSFTLIILTCYFHVSLVFALVFNVAHHPRDTLSVRGLCFALPFGKDFISSRVNMGVFIIFPGQIHDLCFPKADRELLEMALRRNGEALELLESFQNDEDWNPKSFRIHAM